jgi:2-polyprenyl-3-methyl-5-hydroxy-6-metoxy-1,4-benzoquinol methylase
MATNLENQLKPHWNKAYSNNSIDNLGWYEDHPTPSLDLIEKIQLDKNASILNVGAGATTLVDELLNLGYTNILASDLSEVSLDKLKDRLGDKSKQVKWVVDDLTNPSSLSKLEKIDLWHDRAVLHFFTSEQDQNSYFKLLKQLVNIGGHVIIAVFSLSGAEKCCGLNVKRYDKDMLASKLGEAFQLKEHFDYVYTSPSGNSRDYIYTHFQRIK